jgi:hypothetical protein
MENVKPRWQLVLVGLALVFADAGAWAQTATSPIVQIGLYGPGFTTFQKVQFSSPTFLSNGYIAGYSDIYTFNTQVGIAAWLADTRTGVTTRLGYYTGDFVAVNNAADTSVNALADGYVAGSSIRRTDNAYFAWVTSTATGETRRLGYSGAEYTDSAGAQVSFVAGITNGFVGGGSARYIGTAFGGASAWTYDFASDTTTRLGFWGAEYGAPEGYQRSDIVASGNGFFAGTSEKYNGTAQLGDSAWVANAATGVTTRVGFYDLPYTATGGPWAGRQDSIVSKMSGAYVSGSSVVFSGEVVVGQTAWVANAATGITIRIGLPGNEFRDVNGNEHSYVLAMADGIVAGKSDLAGSLPNAAAWMANVTTGQTVRIGLTGASTTAADGSQDSDIGQVAHGHVAGTSQRFSGSEFVGKEAWVADASTGITTKVGLYDALHTSASGVQNNTTLSLADGWLAGAAIRYAGNDENGETAWVFNLQTQELDAITLSINPTTGAAYSRISAIYDTGLAIGTYTLYDSVGASLGPRAFVWTPEDGAFDLANVVEGGISAAGWRSLSAAYFADPSLGFFTGIGVNADGSSAAYLIMPEPGAGLLLCLGSLALGVRRRRR